MDMEIDNYSALVEAVHAAFVFLEHLLEILDFFHLDDHVVMQTGEDDAGVLLPQLLDQLGQFLQGLLIDDLGVPEAEEQWDVIGFHVFLQ